MTQQRALYEESRIALVQAELAALMSRERLHVVMGLSGEATDWTLEGRLPEPIDDDPELEDIEPLAIERSLELLEQRNRIEAHARRVGLARTAGLIPEIRAGIAVEREEGLWRAGPTVEVQLPLFDQGQGRVERSSAQLRMAQHGYVDTAVRVRSAVRRARASYLNAQRRARFYRSTLLPVRQQALEMRCPCALNWSKDQSMGAPVSRMRRPPPEPPMFASVGDSQTLTLTAAKSA